MCEEDIATAGETSDKIGRFVIGTTVLGSVICEDKDTALAGDSDETVFGDCEE